MSLAANTIGFAVHPARRGIHWLKEAVAMLLRARMPWLVLILAYYFIQVVAIVLVPQLGPLVMWVLRPVFAVGFLAAAWTQERGGTPALRDLFRGFHSNLRALLPIGLIPIVGVILVVLLTIMVDDGALLEAVTAQTPGKPIVVSKSVQAAMLFAIACSLPVLLAMWFAPALVVFQDRGPAQALRGSLRASLANWRAILVYGLLLFFYGAVIPGIAGQLIMALVANEEYSRYVFGLLVAPYLLAFATVQTISDYVAYRDIFHHGEAIAIAAPDDAARA